MFCVAWVGADATGRCDVLLRVLLARTSVQSRPFPLHCRGLQAALSPSRQPGSSLGRRDGWRPEREADSSANSASLDRPSAVLPIVALPRNRRTGHMRGELFFRNSPNPNLFTTLSHTPHNDLQAGRPMNSISFWPAFVTRLLTPRSRKFGYGLLLGCRSGLDAGPFQNAFFATMFEKIIGRKPGNSSPSVLIHNRN